MNTPSNNHTTEPRDVASSSSNSTGINLPPRNSSSNSTRINLPPRKPDSKFQRVSHTPLMTEPPGTLTNQVGNKFYEAFQQKHGSYADLPAAKITELMKSSSLDNAPTQSLLSVVNGILEESVERRSGEIPLRVACLLRKVVQEIERRISTQQEHLRTQNNLFKTREEKYKSRISVLEALASGIKEESKNENIIKEEKNAHDSRPTEKIVKEEKNVNDSKLTEKIVKGEKKTDESMQTDNIKDEEEKKEIDKEVIRLIKEVEDKNLEKMEIDKEVSRLIKEVEDKNMKISTLELDIETIQKRYEVECSKMESEAKDEMDKEVIRLNKEIEVKNMKISTLEQNIETIQKRYEVECSKMESETKDEMDKEVIRLSKEIEDKNMEISTLKRDIETIKQRYEAQCSKMDSEAKNEMDKEVIRLNREMENKNMEISTLKQDIETIKKRYEEQCSKLESEAKDSKGELIKEVGEKNMEISTLKQDIETIKKRYEVECSKMESEAKDSKGELIKEMEDKNMEISTLKQNIETIKKRYEEQCSTLESEAKDSKGELIKVVEDKNMEISTLKQDIETIKKSYEIQCSKLESEANDSKGELIKKMEDKNMEISTLKQELETLKKSYEVQCSKLESEVKDAKGELKQKSQEYEDLLEKLRNKLQESETLTKLKLEKWNMKQTLMQKAMNFQFGSIQQLKLSWESIKQDVMKEQTMYSEECKRFGVNIKPLVHAAENYHTILEENRKLFNELQELKGNIRVYCRIRPFMPGQKDKQSIVERIGESDMVVANPDKKGKEALKTFKFNKIFGPASTQAEVYDDIQAFIRSVLDGYNVCIFAYGQTGSGKTYTMSGPNNATNEDVGVNYRALNDLFNISASRQSSIVYEIGVQIIEIYNEQVRDLLSTDASVKKLGILNHSQPNGLAVPDATMLPCKSTADVIKLMDIGLKNRAKSSTAMNERSSRSHSVVSIHVRGADKKSGSTLQGNLHLVDLAGSERIDRSEVTGDRLKEAQHINKSLSALGDVIFALAQKSSHVPYRNSKLTQILQTALGGHAKTLMLVQINSELKSYSESLSTLKFAERVSGVELGVAKSSKDGRDVRELMEQVASLKDTISTKDEEIERLQLLKDLKSSGE
ncbi:kinesin-like protein KIN-14P isoform X4 [Trifolium pratense]|uniref:kinesin-like protein KIN-14P isoform X4 n=1 Tax=Trifolium pratense TaxID=57577 RepID=UPI001E695500|nr:kinesin-like protein KIN-14P isoform X4 [Trifolium pratense]